MNKLIVGNWKMHGEPQMAESLLREVAKAAAASPQHVSVVVCPPAPLVALAAKGAEGSPVAVGAQDCHAEKQGAFTGDTSAGLLKAVGCRYVILGHSERRAHYSETDAQVAAKAACAIESGLIPIICIGETIGQRESGKAEQTVSAQLAECLPSGLAAGNFVLAYEPVWAIGSGKTPSTADIVQMHSHIRAVAAEKTGLQPAQVAVLYGGSVKGDNAAEILAQDTVAGVLVGGASLKAEEFCRIIAAA